MADLEPDDVDTWIRLDRQRLADALADLEQRITARFPRRRLRSLAAAVRAALPDVGDEVDRQRRTRTVLTAAARALTAVLVVGSGVAIVVALVDFGSSAHHGEDWLGLVNNVVGDVVYLGLAVAFLWAVPQRLGRRALVAALHRLRSLAHVVDMHQLSKDPEHLRGDYVPTAFSRDPLTPPDQPLGVRRAAMHHYLTYCVELLGLLSKAAALCGESSSDPVVLETVNEVEALTSDISGKIFAKLQLLPLET